MFPADTIRYFLAHISVILNEPRLKYNLLGDITFKCLEWFLLVPSIRGYVTFLFEFKLVLFDRSCDMILKINIRKFPVILIRHIWIGNSIHRYLDWGFSCDCEYILLILDTHFVAHIEFIRTGNYHRHCRKSKILKLSRSRLKYNLTSKSQEKLWWKLKTSHTTTDFFFINQKLSWNSKSLLI